MAQRNLIHARWLTASARPAVRYPVANELQLFWLPAFFMVRMDFSPAQPGSGMNRHERFLLSIAFLPAKKSHGPGKISVARHSLKT